jgi:hypothetical protein
MARRQSTKWHVIQIGKLGYVFKEYGIGYYRQAFGIPPKDSHRLSVQMAMTTCFFLEQLYLHRQHRQRRLAYGLVAGTSAVVGTCECWLLLPRQLRISE